MSREPRKREQGSESSKRTKRRTLDASKIQEWSQKLLETNDLEMIVLRGHMFLEAQLYEFLATRLNADSASLPNVAFGLLSQITLAGEEHSEMREIVTQFNRIRNDLAHNMDYGVLTSDLENFVKNGAKFAKPEPSKDLELQVKIVVTSVILDLANRKLKLATEWEDLAKVSAERLDAAIDSLRIDYKALAEMKAQGVDIDELLVEDLPRRPIPKSSSD